MNKKPLMLAVALAPLLSCSIFDPVVPPRCTVPVVLRLDDGTPVPAAYHFCEPLGAVCPPGARACATYYRFDDGTVDTRQRCEMYFNPNDFTDAEFALLGKVEGCESDNWLQCHEEKHCKYGAFHPPY